MVSEEEKTTTNEPVNEFLLFPNPNNGQMELQYTIHNKQAAQLIIMDVTGRLISNYELPENSSNLHIHELDLKSGVYFYTIKQNNSILKQAKFVIMK
ncbi:MAG: T9SS type A sorting domain-containing protein [Bacteroidia bacterium]